MDVDASAPEEGVSKMDPQGSATVEEESPQVSEIPRELIPLDGPSMQLEIDTENPFPANTGLLMIATNQGTDYPAGDWSEDRLTSAENSEGLLGSFALTDLSPPRSGVSGRNGGLFSKYTGLDTSLGSVTEDADDGFFWDQPAPPSYQDLFSQPISKDDANLDSTLEKVTGGKDASVTGDLDIGCLSDIIPANDETLFNVLEGDLNGEGIPPPEGFQSDDLTSEDVPSEAVLLENESDPTSGNDPFNLDGIAQSLADLAKDVPTGKSFSSRFGKYEQDLAGLIPQDVFQRAYDADLFELTDSSEDELDNVQGRPRFFSEGDYGDYCVSDTDSGDLTEVTPMSSLAPSPLPHEENADLTGPSTSTEGPSPSGTDATGYRVKDEWMKDEAAQPRQDCVVLNGTLPTFSFDSGMEDGSPLPPQEASQRSSESGRGSYLHVVRQKHSHSGRRSQSMGNGSANLSRSGKVRLRVPRVPVSGRKVALRANRSFNTEQAQRIERDNQLLLGRLVETAQQRRTPYGSAAPSSSQSGRAKHIAPAAIFRQRNIRRIDLENQVLLKRLRIIKASREITANFSNWKPPRATVPKKNPTNGPSTSGRASSKKEKPSNNTTSSFAN